MRIALPYSTEFGEYSPSIVKGGIEKFCGQIINTFDDVHLVYIDDDNTKPTHSVKDNTTKIKNFARSIDADIIISNWPQASFNGSKLLDMGIPIMYVNHTHYGIASIINRMFNLRNYNHSCYMVSDYQHEWYKSMSKRLKRNDDLVVDGYLNPSYVEGNKPDLLDIEYDCCTIGRCEPFEKKPFILKNWLSNTDYRTILMTNTPSKGRNFNRDNEYLQKNSHWNGVLMDLNHVDVMKNLSKSMTYFSTCYHETWGITALEALSHGVPIILNSKKNKHSSTSLCSKDSHYKIVSNKLELSDAIKSFENIDRKEIQDMTWDKHQYKDWKTNFANAIDHTIEKFSKHKIQGL